jgi:hypothetical protein
MGEACKTFIQLIKKCEYYEAHEVLEDIWFPRRFEKDEDILIIKGFINASVAFELVKKGRMEAAKKAWKVYLKYSPLLENSTSAHLPVYKEIEKLLEQKYDQLFRS